MLIQEASHTPPFGGLGLMLTAVGVQAVLEGGSDVQFVIRAAELDEFFTPRIVGLYMGVSLHDRLIISDSFGVWWT